MGEDDAFPFEFWLFMKAVTNSLDDFKGTRNDGINLIPTNQFVSIGVHSWLTLLMLLDQ
ncbi:MAG: hypothetical protein RLZZ522_1746, partial [Verrucomicrobiota bacterium]